MSLYSYVLEELIRGRKILLSHYLNPKLVIVLNIAKHLRGEVAVVDENHYLLNTGLIEHVPDNTVVSDKPVYRGDNPVVYIEPSVFPWRDHRRNILVLLTPGNYRFKLPKHYVRVYLKKIDTGRYELFFKNNMERYRFGIEGLNIVFYEKPAGLLGKAYDLVKNLLIEYGELTVKDAVRILSSELGVDRDYARKILSRLVVEKYIRVEKGRITV